MNPPRAAPFAGSALVMSLSLRRQTCLKQLANSINFLTQQHPHFYFLTLKKITGNDYRIYCPLPTAPGNSATSQPCSIAPWRRCRKLANEANEATSCFQPHRVQILRCAVTCSAMSHETVNSPCPANVPVNHSGRRKYALVSRYVVLAVILCPVASLRY